MGHLPGHMFPVAESLAQALHLKGGVPTHYTPCCHKYISKCLDSLQQCQHSTNSLLQLV